MSVPTIPLYSGVIPNRAVLSPEAFTNAAITWTDYQAVTFIPAINAQTTAVNGVVIGINEDKQAAETAATAATGAASAASASANFIGDWAGKTGSVSVGVSVRHKGAFWRSLVSISNIAASEPSVSTDWAFVSGVRWTDLITSSQSVPVNSQNNAQAIGADVDITLPAFAANDFLVVHCTADSDSLCRLLNPDYTIRGARGTANAGDNLTLKAGDTIHLACVATNILEVV